MTGLQLSLSFIIAMTLFHLKGAVPASKTRYTSKCPYNETEWTERSTEFFCQGNEVYHCFLAEDKDTVKEKCIERTMILEGFCPIFTDDGYLHWTSCNETGCPNSSYTSDKVYKYRVCFGDTDSAKHLTYASGSSDDKGAPALSLGIGITVGVLTQIVAAVIVYYCYLRQKSDEREDLIREYFYGGYTNLEICGILLLRHKIVISVRHLKRIMAMMGLKRRMLQNTVEASCVIMEELQGSGSSLGCRGLQRRLLSHHGLVVSREQVLAIQKELDPIGVLERKQRRLKRRVYHNKGPNYLLHVDGYDKLKRFGFAIHGCVCGFSRRVLWLKVGRSNNDPRVIASYFLDFLKEIKGVPRCIRSDEGTENCIIADIQRAFRWYHDDDMAGERSFLTGSSPSNQRIERWWLSNKQGGGQFWMEFFSNLEHIGKFSTTNHAQLECLRFCFTKLVQGDLNKCAQEWNQHRIRHTKSAGLPGGKPDLMYYLPELYDTHNFKMEINIADVDAAEEFCIRQSAFGCLPDFEEECKNIILENSLLLPTNYSEALALYEWLISYLNA